ncbi:MAG: hypothetical protein QM498_12920 [Desulfobacterium sp.]
MNSFQESHPQPRIRSCLSLPTRIDYIKPIQGYVEGDKGESLMVVLAVEEAVSNVIHHGYESEQGEAFDICCHELCIRGKNADQNFHRSSGGGEFLLERHRFTACPK